MIFWTVLVSHLIKEIWYWRSRVDENNVNKDQKWIIPSNKFPLMGDVSSAEKDPLVINARLAGDWTLSTKHQHRVFEKDFLKVQCAIFDSFIIHINVCISYEQKNQNGFFSLPVSSGCARQLSSALTVLKLPPHFVHFGFFKVQLWLQRLDLREIRNRTLTCAATTARAVETSRTFLVSSFSRSLWAWAFSCSRTSCACLCWSFSWLASLRESRNTRISPFFIMISSSTSFSWDKNISILHKMIAILCTWHSFIL